MATAQSVIERALRKGLVIGRGVSIDSTMAFEALQVLNEFLSSFPARGYSYEHTELAYTDAVNFDDTLITPLTDVLANEFMLEFGSAVNDTNRAIIIKDNATMAWRMLSKALLVFTESTIPDGLLNMPSQKSDFGGAGNGDIIGIGTNKVLGV